MGYTIKVNHPHFAEGAEMNVGGLGLVPNGSSVEVDEDMERSFMLQHGRTLEEAFKNDGTNSVSGSSALEKSEVDSILAMFAEPEEEAPEESASVFDFSTRNTAKDNDEGGET